MKSNRTRSKSLLGMIILICLVLGLSIQKPMYSQVSISQSDIMKIFTPGTPLYFIPGESGQINIGNMNGPNIYDFTFVNMQNMFPALNYGVNQIPALAARYPAAAHTMGEGVQNIVENPVFLTTADSFYIIGDATVESEYRFIHYMPYELFAKFPILFNPPSSSFSQWISVYDTTYNLSWQVISTDFYQTIVDVTIDGYGTLKLPGYDLECLRMKRDYSWFQFKEFIYITREGVMLVVGNVPSSAPNTGLVNGDYHILLAESFVSVEEESNIPVEFKLEQNYPNPFNPTTVISYQLPVSSNVTLKVYDLLGNDVATLVDEYKPAGSYEVEFHATSSFRLVRNLASGIYFYQLKVGSLIQTKKMLLIR